MFSWGMCKIKYTDKIQLWAVSWDSSTVCHRSCSVSNALTSSAGTVTIFQYGAGQAGVVRMLGKYMVASGSMFG